jgi:hypothetical protein
MSEEKPEGGEVSFGEKLLGMQGFNAERARRYRAELEKLLVHRLKTSDRWALGTIGVFMFLSLGIFAVGGFLTSEVPFDSETRWTCVISCAVMALLFGGWFLRIALRGGYSRRLGDMMGMVLALVFGSSLVAILFNGLWIVDDANTREHMLFGGGIVMASTVGFGLLGAIEAMHRRTSEKLLRIEYHLAELMERNSGSTLP